MTEQLPETVGNAMRSLGEALRLRIPDTVEAIYVYGSTALQAYIEGSSDIDFLVFVNRTLTPADIDRIRDAHAETEAALAGIDIMGAYIRVSDAGKSLRELGPVLSYSDRRLTTEGAGDINPITWWILRKHGICAYGRQLPFQYELSADALVRYVIDNMNTYWASWIERLDQMRASSELAEQGLPAAKLDFAVEWCILGMLRQLYTIRERDVTSKIGAGMYGLAMLPERWHEPIREAIAIKRMEPARCYDSQLSRLQDLIALLRLIHAECNRSDLAR